MKKIFVGLIAASAWLSASAGFVDERTVPAPSAAIQKNQVQAQAAAAAAAQAPGAVFEVTFKDQTIREALSRWAASAGWVHTPEHWAVSRDHVVSGAAGADVFGSDFKTAVRTLLDSTTMTDLPVQPCFYSNKIVRVVSRTQSCDVE